MGLPGARDFTAIDGVSQLPASTVNNLQDGIAKHENILNPTTPTTTSNAPQIAIKNSAGNARAVLVDHNGLPTTGGVVLLREDWLVPISAYTTAGAATAAGFPRWYLTTAGSPNGLDTTTDPGTLGLVNVNTSGNKLLVASNAKILIPSNTFQSSVLETDFTMDNIGANSMTTWFGFCGGRDPSSPASGYAWFKKASTDTNWQCQTNDGSSTTTTDSGVTPVIDAAYGQRLRIEFHGSASPYGATKVRFFIGAALVAEHTTHLPTANQYIVMGVSATASSGTGHDVNIGPVVFVANRFPSTPLL